MAILEDHFYHKTISLYTGLFGTVFNQIKIQRDDGKLIAVPIQYASGQKYNERNDKNPDPDGVRYRKTTPRLSFELTGWMRDTTRVKNKLHQLTNVSKVDLVQGVVTKAQYNRVPYTFNFRLDATTKYLDDLLQICEQVLVKFNPSIQVVIKDNPDIDEDSSVLITMSDSQGMDQFEGSFEDSRELTATFNFTLDGYLYMPTRDSSVIQQIDLSYFDIPSLNLIDTDRITPEDL